MRGFVLCSLVAGVLGGGLATAAMAGGYSDASYLTPVGLPVKTATFFATFTGSHVGEEGPVPPTHKTTNTHYVYVLTMNGDDKIARMCKV